MRIGILQPGYLPWLGFFEQLYKSDIFVIYDDVQYDKESWRNRNRIKTASGIQWLTVPVYLKYSDLPCINEVKIDNKTNWRKKHLTSIKQNYCKALFFKSYITIFEEVFQRDWEYLIDLDIYLILKLSEILCIKKEIIKSSTLNITGKRLERLIKICQIFDADTFYEGSSGRNYIDENMFIEKGIKIEYQDYQHPVYNQLYENFIPHLSIIDLLFNHGKESLSILLGRGCFVNNHRTEIN